MSDQQDEIDRLRAENAMLTQKVLEWEAWAARGTMKLGLVNHVLAKSEGAEKS